MDTSLLPILLGIATLLPLLSFALIFTTVRWLKPALGGLIATSAIVSSGVLAFASLAIWLTHHPTVDAPHHDEHALETTAAIGAETHLTKQMTLVSAEDAEEDGSGESHKSDVEGHDDGHQQTAGPYTGDYYLLGQFGKLRVTISYYIDALTIVMFCMVTLIASCIHFYAQGYMHEEEHEVTDHEVTLTDGSHLKRRGRYAVFFQYMSLFCFSMLGLVLAGNVAMVFVFWELVGICSYFLIGFYIERKSASNAANKAFIVNRIGDFGMIIGLMALWTGLGTFAFGDVDQNGNGAIEVSEQGIFSQVRPAEGHHALVTPAGMVQFSSRDDMAAWVRENPGVSPAQVEAEFDNRLSSFRQQKADGSTPGYGYWMLIIAGIGIFCGCVGKSAQFPLHVWLPDAMEGPTPVSALVHSATMVAAGVYLVGRFYPVFTPEVLMVIAIIGVITLFMAATIAITATDIKRVLAYSTVSQLGYMMVALGVGGWLAGMMHLVTHAFFKSLLFLCSGSVIHAVHTNEMTEMGGLRKKMPVTAYTMLIGCLAIAGVSLPFVIGFSGYYSKDMILEQAFSFMGVNRTFLGGLFFAAAAGGAAITAFYMFRLWFMTFAGEPRDRERYEHAHESPRVMYIPLIVLAVFATAVAWKIPFSSLGLQNLLEQARPVGTAATVTSAMTGMTWPDEHFAHQDAQFWSIVFPVTLLATATALGGITVAIAMYGLGFLKPDEVRRQFPRLYTFLRNKWWFDELYEWLFIRPTHLIAAIISRIDLRWIDGLIHALAAATKWFARTWDRIADQGIVDGLVNLAGRRTYRIGVSLKGLQTGSLRQYVMFIVIGAIAIFLLISFLWSPTFAQ
jgi:NADH:ubiquinone oxidoreductase subunit 5 (subunit L)/multisubunit Na+/H+ antiporter MnhA subunit